MVGEEGSEQIGGHERVVVGDKGSGFGDDRGLGGVLVLEGGLGGGLDGEGGLHLPPVAVGVEGGGGPPAVQLVECAEEQVELGLAVHGGGGVVWGHFTSAILDFSFPNYSEARLGLITGLRRSFDNPPSN